MLRDLIGFGSEGPLVNAVLDLFAKSGNHDFAEKVFQRLPRKISWPGIRFCLCTRNLDFWIKLVLPYQFTHAIAASVSVRLGSVWIGKQLHCDVIKMGFEFCSFCEGSPIYMYVKNNCMIDARQLFDGAKPHDTISWAAIIGGYGQSGMPFEALRLFDEMQKVGLLRDEVAHVTAEEYENHAFSMFRRMVADGINPDEVSLASIPSACANLQAIEKRKQIHRFSVKIGLGTSLFLGKLPYSHAEGMDPSEITLASLLDACSDPSQSSIGRSIYCYALKAGLLDDTDFLGVSLLGMYLNCQRTADANILLHEFPSPKTILWTAVIAGHIQNNNIKGALLWIKK
ncbi:Pentatricopeptide repeat [Dillenia turbinata]|uniref:Pentatricopeptide repeat n=1 Tax=Dillenia turbinata TaxID=194707 RepID=A0AAN8ZLC5_9MAGN